MLIFCEGELVTSEGQLFPVMVRKERAERKIRSREEVRGSRESRSLRTLETPERTQALKSTAWETSYLHSFHYECIFFLKDKMIFIHSNKVK